MLGVDMEEIQVLPVRLRSMVDVINGQGSHSFNEP